MRSSMFVASALLLLPLTGCGSDDQPAATTSRTTSPTTTTTTTTTTVPVPEVAADGTNLQACEDGTCEVEIKTGDVLSIRGARFTVTSVGAEGVTMVLPSGSVMSLGGTGTINTGSGTTIEILRNNAPTALIRVSISS